MESRIFSSLRRQRNHRGLTLQMLSVDAGMSAQHISEIESGKLDPRLSTIERLADAMGMTVLIVPDVMAADIRRSLAKDGPNFTIRRALTSSDRSKTLAEPRGDANHVD